MDKLAEYLMERTPAGLDYEDAAQLCMRLFIYVGDVPESLLPLDKERLGDVFAELTAAEWVHQDYQSTELCGFRYGAHFEALSTRGHWLKVIRSMLRDDLYNRKKAEAIARQVGFVVQRPVDERGPTPNDDPARPLGDSGLTEGSPSAS